MPNEVIEWIWNPKQADFITTPKRYAAFVGAMGSGKTAAFCRRAIAIAYKYPDTRMLLARYTYEEVNNILIPQFFEILPQQLIRKWRRSEGVLEIRAGPKGLSTSTILFRNLDAPKKYRSENLNAFGISQADDAGITEEHWQELTKRLRRYKGKDGPIPRQYAFLEANYRGHNWIWQLFTKEGQLSSKRTEIPQFNTEDYFLIEGQTQDNEENLPPEYIADMEAMPDEWKKRHYYGSWEEAGGLVYDFQTIHISPGVMTDTGWSKTIPSHWHRYRAVDHGMRNVTVCLWATMSPSGTVYIYDEYYQPGIARVHAKNIYRKHAVKDPQSKDFIPTERYQWTVIDPSSFNKESTSGESAANQYFEEGVPVVKAPATERDVGSGIAVVQKYLSALDPHTQRPRLQIISGAAPNLVREIKEYVWDEIGPIRRTRRNEPERPRKLNDHALDALRYLLVSRPQPSPEKLPKKEETYRGMNRQQVYENLWEV